MVVTLTPAGRMLRRRAPGIAAMMAGAAGSATDRPTALTTPLQRLRAALNDTGISAAA